MSKAADEDTFKRASGMRLKLNVGCLMDIPTGSWMVGKYGEYYNNGGMGQMDVIQGPPNSFKTELALYRECQVLSHWDKTALNFKDTEDHFEISRIARAMAWHPNLHYIDVYDPSQLRVIFSDRSVYPGLELWLKDFRQKSASRASNKKLDFELPYWNKATQSFFIAKYPELSMMDSLSSGQFTVIEDTFEKNELGNSGNNMVHMKANGLKTMMIQQMPGLLSPSGIYITFTGHIGEKNNLDPYKADYKSLAHQSNNLTGKYMPKNLEYLSTNQFQVMGTQPCVDRDKLPEYPRDSSDVYSRDTDLMVLTIKNLRGKGGPAGIPFEIIASQSMGIQPALTEFNYCRMHKFGLTFSGSGNSTMAFDLLPDVTFTRKSIRQLIDDDPRVARVARITSELAQMRRMCHGLNPDLKVHPAEIYQAIKAKGYNIEELYNTVSFVGDCAGKPPHLSTMDLVNIKRDVYVPYWLK